MADSTYTQFLNQALARWKWVCSFFVRDWDVSDYPIAVREQEVDGEYASPRLRPVRFWAFFVNWNYGGGGETRGEAYAELVSNFEKAKAEKSERGERLPRPGAKVPIVFADSEKVDANPALRDDFIQRVLGLEWAFVSDESSLWDFHTDLNNDQLNARVKDIYGVDVSDIESGRLCLIFERLAGHESYRSSS